MDEARVARLLDHDAICRLIDFGDDAGALYMVVEWMDGDSLRSAVGRAGPPTVVQALRIARHVARALHAAHELRSENGRPLDLVHRDVSPHNVLLGIDGRAKLIDFGIAKTRERVSTTTNSGVLKGKLRYMAPEQVEGGPVDRRADIWALGAVLRFLATGEELFGDKREADVLRLLVMREELPQPSRPLPAPIAPVIARALAHEPDARFPTADAMREAIEDALATLGASLEHADDRRDLASYALRAVSEEVEMRRALLDDAAATLAPALGRMPSRRGMVAVALAFAAVSVPVIGYATVNRFEAPTERPSPLHAERAESKSSARAALAPPRADVGPSVSDPAAIERDDARPARAPTRGGEALGRQRRTKASPPHGKQMKKSKVKLSPLGREFDTHE